MANSNERKPFRPLGLRMLSLSRQIIQTYAATDPIARQMLPRAMQAPNYEPLTWDEGDSLDNDDSDGDTTDIDNYQPMFPDMPPSARPSRPQQSSQPPVQRKKSQSPPAGNPRKLVDVGGIKVPDHVVQAFRNHQKREAQKAENRQKLADEAGQMDKDSILAKRQKRGRGMSIDYVSTDSLRGDKSTPPSQSPATSDSDDSESDSAPQTSNSPPTVDGAIMRETDATLDTPDDSDYFDSFDTEGTDDEDYSTYQTDDSDTVSTAQSPPSIQRTPDFDSPSDDADFYNDFDSDYADDSDTIDDSSYDFDASVTDTAPTSRSERNTPSVQRTPDFDSADDDNFYSDFEADDSDTDTPPISRSERNTPSIQRTPDFDSADDDNFYNDFDADDSDTDTPPISRSEGSTPSIQRTPDFDSADDDNFYNDFEADNSDTDTPPMSRSEGNTPSIQRTPDFDSADDDLYSDFDVDDSDYYDDSSGDFDTPVSDSPPISRSSRNERPIQRTPDFDSADDDLYNDFADIDSGDFDTPVSDSPPINRSERNARPIQRTPDFDSADDDLYSDFNVADGASDDISQSPQSIQRSPVDGGDLSDTPPLSGPVIEDDYYDFSLQTDRMSPITAEDIAAYDARKAETSSNDSIQRSPISDDGGYDGFDYADSGPRPDLHEALFAAGAVDTPPIARQPRIQRSPSLFDEFADEWDATNYEQTDSTAAPDTNDINDINEVGSSSPHGQVQRSPSLYDDFAPDDSDTMYNTSDSGQENIQRTPDNNASSGDLKADLLTMMGLSPDTPVTGFNDVFGSGKQQSTTSDSSSDAPVQRQMIERSVEPPPPLMQRAALPSTSNDISGASAIDSDDAEDDKAKINKVAQQVYKQLKQRLRVEWERRNRF
ncbi:MAG: hypothetical protein Q9P44_02625 [Anaerolineae bacterium]|nr:hypothetical protein [Anaerolineae bacterium]